MPFYKRDGEALQIAPNFVYAPEFTLDAETHDENTYPVDGWYWFDTLDDALASLPRQSVVNTITPLQAKLALHGIGLLATVESLIAAADVPTQLAWREATAFSRTSPLLNSMATALGMTSEQVDALFLSAATIEV
jgi:hypothetical protein